MFSFYNFGCRQHPFIFIFIDMICIVNCFIFFFQNRLICFKLNCTYELKVRRLSKILLHVYDVYTNIANISTYIYFYFSFWRTNQPTNNVSPRNWISPWDTMNLCWCTFNNIPTKQLKVIDVTYSSMTTFRSACI